MTEKQIPVIDIEPRINASSAVQPGIKNSLGWSRSDNSFKFDFITKDGSFTQTDIAVRSQESAQKVHHTGSTAFTEQGPGFAFNFKITEGTEEKMKTDTVADPPLKMPASDCNKPTKEDKPQQNEPHASSKAKKKKKKSGNKKKTTESTEQQEKQTISSPPISEARGDEGTVLSAEQQLKRELDWCIEQLELGLSTQKSTTKQKEEACRNLKTLRSSKAPLAKKRQVMRAMSGDYRKKMEEEKDKQFKLIQAAMTSAKVKAVNKGVEKSVFHRKADSKTETLSQAEKDQQENTGVQNQEETSSFVFTPAKEEFCFNFL
ncbi:UPF0488 protein C8orf33 homolog [Osmerus mordax]|uniref:UPF0488 protein C8orf33 homolog n=1 Tax=Osmerus mordax TaxID=8014 RepID=UPI00350F2F74